MEKCKLSDDEVFQLVTKWKGLGKIDGLCGLVDEALRLQRERIVARIRKEAELFDADLGGDALSNIADLLERDS